MAGATLLTAGCSAGRTGVPAVSPPAVTPSAVTPSAGAARPAPPAADDSLEAYIARVRARSHQAGIPRMRSTATSVEQADPVLRDALDRLALAPGPERHRAVASAYLRVGIADKAFDHFTAAVALDRTDAAAYDSLARIWRDWGFANLGLSDAHRAVYYAPSSAAARNTLGTLLQALGLTGEARRAYDQAVALDPGAAYAISNLCALDLAEGRLADAARTCQRALEIDAGLFAARRNLALVRSLQVETEPVTADRGSADATSRPPRD